jgi:hypothetical protein
VEEFRFTEHEPDPSETVQDALSRLPGPLTIEKLITVPFGAFVNPDPSFTWTLAVRA